MKTDRILHKIIALCLATGLLILVIAFMTAKNPYSVKAVTDSADGDAEGTIHYVSTYGSDSNEGTLENPWRTIQWAANNVIEGDTVIVMSGTYPERVTMKKSGAPDKYITFRSNEPGKAIIDGSSFKLSNYNDSLNSLIYIEDKSYIRIEDFNISNLVSAGAFVPAGIRVMGNSDNIEITGSKVSGIRTTYDGSMNRNAHGIAAYGTNGNDPLKGLLIDECEISDCILGQSESVVLNGNVTDFKVTNNKVHDNDNIGIDFIGYEGVAPSNDYARDGICAGNEVYNISTKANKTYGVDDLCADGIYVDGGSNITIERNKVYMCDIGIECASEHKGKVTRNILIRNNLIYECTGYCGIAIGGYSSNLGSAEGIRIFNNTLYKNLNNMVFQYNCQFASNEVMNNIFYSGIESDIYGNQTNIKISSNLATDPGFEAPGSVFSLTGGSQAIDSGFHAAADDSSIGLADIANNNRVSGLRVDCGCYEFQQ